MVFSLTKPSQHIKLRQALRDPAMRLAFGLLVVFLGAQGWFWNHTRAIKPEMTIVSDVPGESTVRALSFGDEEALFRLLALQVQISGDTFGRFTALYKYDYSKLYHWFRLLDTLNRESNHVPAMAAYYFSQTQNVPDVRYIVDYLDEYTAGREKEKWWWITQAVYQVNHKLGDKKRALELANRLRGIDGIPIWARQLPAFILESLGEFDEAAVIIEEIAKNPDQYTQGELNFMRYFAQERIRRMDMLKDEFDRVQKRKDEQRKQGVPEPVPMGPPKDVGAPTLGGEE